MATWAVKQLLVNVDSRKLIKSTTQIVDPTSAGRLNAVAGDMIVLGVSFVNQAGVAYGLGAGDTFDCGFDKDFAHVLDEGTAGAGYSGAVVSIAVAGLTETIPTTGYIVLINGSGETDRVAYTNYAAGTFTVSATLDYVYLLGDTVQVEDELMAFADNTAVDVAGDWADISRANGKISIRLNCNTDAFARKVSAATGNDLLAYLQIRRYPSGETQPTTMLQDWGNASKAVIDGEGTPGTTQAQYLTQTSADARYVRNAANLTNVGRVTKVSAAGTITEATIAEGSITGVLTVAKSGTTARTATFPDAAITIAGTNYAQTWTAAQTYTTGLLIGDDAKARTSAGFAIISSGGSTCVTFGAGGGCNASFGDGATFEGTVNVTHSGGVQTQQAATQDAMRILGRAGGTGTYIGTITPTTLSASRTYTMPDASIVVAGSATALTAGYIPVAAAGGLLADSDLAYADGVISRAAGLQLPANVGIGTAVDLTRSLIFDRTSTDPAAAQVGSTHRLNVTTTTNNANGALAIQSRLIVAPAAGTTNSGGSTLNVGVLGAAYSQGEGTVSNLRGVWADVGTNTGVGASSVVTDAAGLTSRVLLTGVSGSSITTYKGLNLIASGATTTITNYWGLYEDLGTGAKNYLAHALLIGTTSAVGSEIARFAGGTAATPTANDVTIGGGSVRSGADSYFNAIRVGLGGGAVSTNTCVGNDAMAATASGANNSAFGNAALAAVTSGAGNSAFGYVAATALTTGSFNCAFGQSALYSSIDGSQNTAIGYQSLFSLTSSYTTALGYRSGRYQIDGTSALTINSYGLFIGHNTKGTQSASNEIAVGYAAEGKGSNTAVWGNTSITDHYMTGRLNVNQSSTTGAKSVAALTQADVDQPFLRFIGTAAASTIDRSIVKAADASATIAGYVKVYVEDLGDQVTDQAYYLPVYTLS